MKATKDIKKDRKKAMEKNEEMGSERERGNEENEK